MKNSIHLLLFSLLVFSSCLPEPLEIDIPELDPQVVVFSQILPGELTTVVLTKTLNALAFSQEEGDTLSEADYNDLLVDGAQVSIAYRDQIEYLTAISAGVYAGIETPQIVNETYTLNVVTPNGDSLSATSKILPRVSFSTLVPQVDRSTTDTLVQVNFRIADLPEDNWYLLNFYTNSKEGSDLDTLLGSDGDYLKHTELIEDRLWESGPIEKTIELSNVRATDSLFITLANVTEEYFRFLEVRKNASNLFTELTKEPINSPSNVEGGLGFFNMYLPEVYFFDLGKF